jgi:hypothetical protein
MFSATLKNPNKFIDILTAISELIPIFSLNINKSGWDIKTFDSNNEYIAYLYIDKDEFTDYICYDVCYMLVLDIEYLLKTIKEIKYDKLSFKLEDDILFIIDTKLSGETNQYEIITEDEDLINNDIIFYDYSLELVYTREGIEELLYYMDKIDSPYISFNVDKKLKNIICKGINCQSTFLYDSSKGYINETSIKKLNINNNGVIDTRTIVNQSNKNYKVYPCDDTFTAKYNYNNIRFINKLSQLVDNVVINLSDDSLLRIDMVINEDNGSIFHLFTN